MRPLVAIAVLAACSARARAPAPAVIAMPPVAAPAEVVTEPEPPPEPPYVASGPCGRVALGGEVTTDELVAATSTGDAEERYTALHRLAARLAQNDRTVKRIDHNDYVTESVDLTVPITEEIVVAFARGLVDPDPEVRRCAVEATPNALFWDHLARPMPSLLLPDDVGKALLGAIGTPE